MIEIPYEIVKLIGWSTVVLVSLAILKFISAKLNQILHKKNPKSTLTIVVKKITKILFKFHSTFGIIAVFTAVIHGYNLYGLNFDFGYILWTLILLLALTGILMKIKKLRSKFKPIKGIHRTIVVVLILFIVLHILSKNYIIELPLGL